MKVVYDHQIFSVQRYGGISRYFFELAKGVAEVAADATVNVNSPLYVNGYLSGASSSLGVLGHHLPVFRGAERICCAANTVLSPVIMGALRPDIVHETYYSSRPSAPRSSRTVITVHDMIHELFPQSFPEQDKTWELKRQAVKRADHVICVSEQTRQDLVRLLDVPLDKTSVVHHGFSLTTSDIEAVDVPARPYLLYVGMRGGYKNFETLLQAYASQPWLKENFDLVAFGGGGFTAYERALIARLGIVAKVHQQGGSDQVLAARYKQAALFVYPSLYEGFGIPPLEAMSYGCPVVCSNTSSIPEVVGAAARMFDPSSTESLAVVLLEVLQRPEACQELRRLGLLRVNEFSWHRCALETHAIYQRVLS
ncbi:glycosyltransferase family 1 protein [Ectopseudomonas mendocina]|uniref:Glycosyltransferase family 1 protein n=1 Tax=Ectopseudomonas mendocina TaxID=300 RepID=A0A2R3QTW9_ECTME|nr:glycosyltransferase family 1 protein [Pseudomonas mendocina]AVO55241.1 glycosyltransferase family 1 protein [Pseudomonas mendocina]